MAKASIHFEDTEDGVLFSLNFDNELPDNPEDATEAQMQAMVAFTQFLAWSNPEQDELEIPLNEDGHGDVYEPEV